MAVGKSPTRLPKEKWVSKWNERDLKQIDERAQNIRSRGAIDDYSAWSIAEREYYHETVNFAGFKCR